MGIKRKLFLSLLTLHILIAGGCRKDSELNTGSYEGPIKGHVQKGPFLIGTSITVSELNAEYHQTGNTFLTQITNNLGNFELNNVSLVSNYVALRADGFYLD